MRSPLLEASIYIHVPFCTVLCPFCDFYKRQFRDDLEPQFIDALCQEMSFYEQTTPIKVPTLFLGGGTPSVLSADSFLKMRQYLDQTFDCSELKEFSIEMNPEDVTEARCSILKEVGVSRVSLGVQSFLDAQLHFLGRGHTAQQSKDALELLSRFDFDISVDIIFGLPNSNCDELKQSLDLAFSYPITHVSTYCLTIEEGTEFHRKQIRTVGSEKEREQYEYIQAYCKVKGFEQYEVSSFSPKDKQSVHNKRYWFYEDYIGLGPGAHSLIYPYRFDNKASLTDYIKDTKPDFFDQSCKPLTVESLMSEHMIAGLRMREGIDLKKFKKRHGLDILDVYSQPIQTLKAKQCLHVSDSHIWASEEGVMFLDEISSEFI